VTSGNCSISAEHHIEMKICQSSNC